MKIPDHLTFHAPGLSPRNIKSWKETRKNGLAWKAPFLSSEEMQNLCRRLKENARDKLSALTQKEIAEDLGKLSHLWLNKNYSHRKRAEKILASASGCSLENIREGLDLAFKEATAKKLLSALSLINQFPKGGLTHCIFAGIISTPILFDIYLSLLRKSAVIAKSPSREPFFPILLARSLKEISPILGECTAALWWPGGQAPFSEKIPFEQASWINAYGDDDSVAKMAVHKVSGQVFIPLGHKVSLSVIECEASQDSKIRQLTEKIAYDVSLYDQQGCLSPHVVYVEKTSGFHIQNFIEQLAQAMRAIEKKLPIGRLSLAEASRIHQVRGQYQFKKDTFCLTSHPNTDWTVIYEKATEFHPSCLNRVIFVKPLDKIESLRRILKNWKGKIQGLAYETQKSKEESIRELAEFLNIPILRPLGQIQRLEFENHVRERLWLQSAKKP